MWATQQADASGSSAAKRAKKLLWSFGFVDAKPGCRAGSPEVCNFCKLDEAWRADIHWSRQIRGQQMLRWQWLEEEWKLFNICHWCITNQTHGWFTLYTGIFITSSIHTYCTLFSTIVWNIEKTPSGPLFLIWLSYKKKCQLLYESCIGQFCYCTLFRNQQKNQTIF